MEEGGIYQLIIVCVGAFALAKGFRRGFTGQISGLLGLGFGAVFAMLFAPEVEVSLAEIFSEKINFPFPPFLYGIVASSLIYFAVYLAVRFLTGVIRNLMRSLHIGMLDRLFGSAFCLFKYLMVVSIVYNLILCIKPDSSLLEYSKAADGNLVQDVLMLAPAVLGCFNADDLSHAMQLLDAKKISCNFNAREDVIKMYDNAIS